MSNMNSIGKFTDVIDTVKWKTFYIGDDDEGNLLYDETKKLPTLTFKGTTKIHGSFAGIKWDGENIIAMSKESVITPQKDNAGFAMMVEGEKEFWKEMLIGIEGDFQEISIMGEVAGPRIQKGVGINLLPEKSFFMFGIKYLVKGEEKYKWAELPEYILGVIAKQGPKNVYSLHDFKTWEINVDFNNPKEALKTLDEIMNEVDKLCPVAESLGYVGVGEGNVWISTYKDERLIFKIKGESHSKVNKIRQPKEKDPREQEKLDFAEKVVTKRLRQAVQEVCDTNNGGKLTMKDLGSIIKWVINDVIKEEALMFKESNFSVKDVNKYISAIVVSYVKQEIEDEAMK